MKRLGLLSPLLKFNCAVVSVKQNKGTSSPYWTAAGAAFGWRKDLPQPRDIVVLHLFSYSRG